MNEQWQELKETIIEMRDNDGIGTQQEVCKFLANYMDTLEKQITDEWIPVSERLPKDGQKVLVTTRSDNILDADLDTSIFYHASAFWKHYVIAWMPLPQPYKAESKED